MDKMIPDEVFNIYNEVVDYMIDDAFGVICQTISIEKVEQVIGSDPETNHVPTRNSINAHRKRGGGGYDRGNVTVVEKEVLEDIKLRCYFDRRDWVKFKDSNIVVPDADMQTIGYMADMPKLEKCKGLIVHKEIKKYGESRYARVGDPMPWGFKKNRYVICHWKRS